jgi:hypothetical protein
VPATSGKGNHFTFSVYGLLGLQKRGYGLESYPKWDVLPIRYAPLNAAAVVCEGVWPAFTGHKDVVGLAATEFAASKSISVFKAFNGINRQHGMA